MCEHSRVPQLSPSLSSQPWPHAARAAGEGLRTGTQEPAGCHGTRGLKVVRTLTRTPHSKVHEPCQELLLTLGPPLQAPESSSQWQFPLRSFLTNMPQKTPPR